MNALLAFFLGQFSLAVLLFAFIKFFIFGEPPPPSHLVRRRASSFALRRPPSRSRTKFTSVLRPTPKITTESILSKTFYNVSGHQPESLDWFNVLVAQALAQLREDASQDGAILKSLNAVLNGEHKPSFVGDIRVTEISLGEEYPIFSNCRIIPVEEKDSVAGEAGSRLQARLDVDLSDCITLGVETKLVLNYPKALVAVLPVALAVSVERFSATLSLSFIPSADPPAPKDDSSKEGGSGNSRSPTTLAFSFQPDYRLDISVRSLVGSRSRLQDVPKIAQIVEARIHQWFDERCVEPRVQQIVLPNLWPRKKNTRGGDEDDEAIEEDMVDELAERANGGYDAMQDTGYEDSLEARMAAEGRKIREAERKEERERRARDQPQPTLRRRPGHKSLASAEGFKMPGHFE
ncbi:uncharacterized protein PV09_00149 [Verruconis gallopava]|uniref:Maintenance of mitochondrial morphology protein 1 n=1 Tax=Verruconis gallopava TaxID=253628 RepID=A0A0D1Z8A8_9PEZI|nr:uncharacterized protein PV09_00149 [Verruconis gallopava]KIW09222.1 hypothetical protein PV09_00149 [Verruconis gallopava]